MPPIRSFFCPHCFNRIKVCDLLYKDSKCNKFQSREPHWLERCGVLPSPRSIQCTLHKEGSAPPYRACAKCSHVVSQRYCPRCEEALPMEIDNLSDITIAIVGAKSSGKSHFIALLIKRLTELYRTFDWVLTPLTQDTIDTYRDRYSNPLFSQKVTITSTPKGEEPVPLMYSLRFKKTGKRVMLVFFDAAGEDFTDENSLRTYIRYVCNASGIICLLDPLQLPHVHTQLKQRNCELPDVGERTEDVLHSLTAILREHFLQKLFNTVNKNGIPIPLAVAFSKVDAIRRSNVPDDGEDANNALWLDDHCTIYQESRHNGVYNASEMEDIHYCMESWLHTASEDALVNSLGNYKDCRLFAFSALGAPPKGDTLLRTPTPIRVEDAFLWILARNGLIDTTT